MFNKRVMTVDEPAGPAHRGTSSRQRPWTASNFDKIGQGESYNKAIIEPEYRVAEEDYFRGIKENKI